MSQKVEVVGKASTQGVMNYNKAAAALWNI